jgi:pimeloyl-ACP methyl ester carboxylesterase/DNA-binding winged helix-turn-helix (wHTH) protein
MELPMRYRFDDCEVDLAGFTLRRDGATVHLEPQAFEVLVHLMRHRDRLVSKNELLDTVWGTRFVSESAVTSQLKMLRRAVGDDGAAQRVIRTVRGRGYQFVAQLAESGAAGGPDARPGADDLLDLREPEAGAPAHKLDQQIRFATSPDTTLVAYATAGDGPPLVKAANWLTHLDYDWESPTWRHWLEGMARRHTLVRYDERGCGLSDWDVDRFTFDAWVDDLELVADAAGLDRFPVVGISQGAAVAIAYAVRHPERVSALVLWGAYGRGRLARAVTEQQRREAALDLELARVAWGRDDDTFLQVFTSQFLPDGTREQWSAFNELQRRTTSPDNAVRFLETFATIDVIEQAQQVRCPTLILHARHDLRVPLASARELAALIPGSRLVPLDSRNHILVEDEPAWPRFLDEVERFVSAHPTTPLHPASSS